MKGERVTCENGHLVAIFRRDVRRYETAKADSLQWATGAEQRTGEPVRPCHCGSFGFRWHDGFRAHMEEGWR